MSKPLHRPRPILTDEIVTRTNAAGVVLASGAGRIAACSCGWRSETPPSIDDLLVEAEWAAHFEAAPQRWISRRTKPAGVIEPSSTL
jgi:hypothetical protein